MCFGTLLVVGYHLDSWLIWIETAIESAACKGLFLEGTPLQSTWDEQYWKTSRCIGKDLFFFSKFSLDRSL